MDVNPSDKAGALGFIHTPLPADCVAPLQIAIVLEYVNGGSLGDILQKVGPNATQSVRS